MPGGLRRGKLSRNLISKGPPCRAFACRVPLGGGRSTGDFLPQLLRSFPSRVNVVQVAVGSDMLGAHTLAVSRNGRLYSHELSECGLELSSLAPLRLGLWTCMWPGEYRQRLGRRAFHGFGWQVSTPTLVTKFLGTGAGAGHGCEVFS